MVSLDTIDRYVQGYSDRKNMKIVAFRFIKLGEMLLDLPQGEYDLYLETHRYIYSMLNDGLRHTPTTRITFDLDQDDFPVDCTDGCDEYVPEIVCEINMFDIDDELIRTAYEFFPLPLDLRVNRYNRFVTECVERTLKTGMMPISLDDTTMDAFANYAFMIGAGMPVSEAIKERRNEVQSSNYNLQ